MSARLRVIGAVYAHQAGEPMLKKVHFLLGCSKFNHRHVLTSKASLTTGEALVEPPRGAHSLRPTAISKRDSFINTPQLVAGFIRESTSILSIPIAAGRYV